MNKKMIGNEDTFAHPVCNKCKHYINDIECQAFNKIPTEILNGDNDHSQILPIQQGYNNIIFEQK